MNNFDKYFREKVADKQKIKNYVYSNRKKEVFFMKKKLIAALSLVLLFVAVAVTYNGQTIMTAINPPKYSYVTIDINPSVELILDEDNKVVEVVTLNEDADIAYSDLKLIGKDIEAASTIIVNEAIVLGYLNEFENDNAVNVTTYADNETLRLKTNQVIADCLDIHFKELGIGVMVLQDGLGDELKTKAEEYDISYGKILLIERAISLNDELVEAELVDMTIKDIQTEIKQIAQARKTKVIANYVEKKMDLEDVKQQLVIATKEKLAVQKQEILKNNGAENYSEAEQLKLLEQIRLQIRLEINKLTDEMNGNEEGVRATVRERFMEQTGTQSGTQTQTQTQIQTQSGTQTETQTQSGTQSETQTRTQTETADNGTQTQTQTQNGNSNQE